VELKSMGVAAALAGCAERAQAPPRVADPCTVVMFGATGDLAMRKLVPAFYNLKREGLLSDRFAVVGVGRNAMTQEMYRQKVDRDARAFVPQPVDSGRVEWLSKGASYVSGGYDHEATYRRLSDRLSADGAGLKNVLFYLATPPSLFGPIIERLGSVGLLDESADAWRRVIIEKPFGRDLVSARALNRRIRTVLQESQIYRIDHYLGKETVQNIMALRFGNGIFEPIWNRRYVDRVQITVAETVGVEQRGG
jgi:glucose-6-phosphate 1-dehydrogenase